MPPKPEDPDLAAKPPKDLWSIPLATLLAGFYLVTSLYIASRRPFWFDEVVTVLFARLPGVLTIWKAVCRIDPWVPVPAYLIVHVFQSIFGAGQIAIRLPSTLGMALGLLITFDCARRLSDGLHGLLAVALLTCSFLPYYGFEARSYGVYFMLAALSLWLWVHTGMTRGSAAMFCATIFLSCAVHPYAVLCLLPYAVSDLLSRRPWWRPSGKLLAGALGACFAAGLLGIQMLAIQRTSGGFPGPGPSLPALQHTYAEVFPSGLFLLALMAVWICLLAAPGKSTLVMPMHPAERVGWLCLSIPIAGLVVALLVTHAFAPRYFIGMLPGIGLAFGCSIWRHFNHTRAAAFGILTLLATVGVTRQINLVRHPESIDPFGQQTQTREFLSRENDIWNDGKQFILWNGNFLYLPAHYYSHHQERYVFLQPETERERASLIIPLGFSAYYPYRIWTIKDLQQHARETAVIHPRPATVDAMQKAGFQADVRYTSPIEVVYFK